MAILGFVFLFKIGEAFLGRMSVIFYKEIGFTKSDIALYSKGLGWVTTVIFTLLGGLFAIRSGVIQSDVCIRNIDGFYKSVVFFACLVWKIQSFYLP